MFLGDASLADLETFIQEAAVLSGVDHQNGAALREGRGGRGWAGAGQRGGSEVCVGGACAWWN